MVVGSIGNHMEGFLSLDENIMKCLQYAKENEIASFAPGRYELDGDKMYVNIEEYETQSVENRGWEAHHSHIDIQMILEGEEQIDLNFIRNMKVLEECSNRDVIILDGEKQTTVVLGKNDFVVCYPDDAHRPGIAPKLPAQVKKAVFKIEIGE